MPGVPQTERRNPRTRGLDRKSTVELLRLLNREDRRVPSAVARAVPTIAQAVERAVAAIERGGRMIYVGAGTSGRLAALDAAECPPTFGIARGRVRAVIAGGRRALDRAVEGAEDSAALGARDLAAAGVDARDVVVGLAASGATPYVMGALREARRRGAATVVVSANPRPAAGRLADVTIVAATGPEAVTGSTRLKSGTAQKMILNMLSTASMAKLGRVYDNWMIGVAMTNRKLRRRGLRLLADAAGTTAAAARRALERASGNLPAALVMLEAGVSAAEAKRRLRESSGHVRRAIEAKTPGADGRRANPRRGRTNRVGRSG